MHRPGVFLAALVLAAVTLGTASARTDGTRTICHFTASKKTPYVKLRLSAKPEAAHLKHAEDIIPAPSGGCPRTLLTPTSGGRAFEVALTGEAQTPAGDPVGTGTVTIRLRAGQGQLCYRLDLSNLPPAVAAHIHQGSSGAAGPVVVPLQTPGSDGVSSGCALASRPLVKAMLADAASHYVNVHTAEFPAGALRGQLVGTSSGSLGRTLALDLKGTTEPNAKGTAVLRFLRDAGLMCYRLHVESVTLPTVAAHIHRGEPGASGAVVVAVTTPGADGNSSGCAPATAPLIDEILANPRGFYVNVHTKEHPGGAIRTQLG